MFLQRQLKLKVTLGRLVFLLLLCGLLKTYDISNKAPFMVKQEVWGEFVITVSLISVERKTGWQH